ncbi:MAG: rhomboid family intramembrane serine protease [Planctomycetes bacterium]|nr:rhomboid family intramembrane serine protease [Planctomycetota bacterium]
MGGVQLLHAGWLHLIGNLIFVWGFGIVVEGKLGW